MSAQGLLFDRGDRPERYQVVNRDEQGWVLRGRAGVAGRAVRVQGRNAAGEVVVHDCDSGGRDLHPLAVGVLPADHPWVTWKAARIAARSA